MWEWITWAIVVLAVWVVVAASVAVLLGRIIRRRDQQTPVSTPESFPPPRAPRESSVSERRRPS